MLDILTTVSPWTIATIALIVVLIDLVVLSSEYLLWLGISGFYMALAAAFHLSPELQVGVFAMGTFVNLGLIRTRLGPSNKKSGLAGEADDLLGLPCAVLSIDEEHKSHGRAVVEGHGEWRIRNVSNADLKARERMTVLAKEGMVLVVKKNK